MARKKIPKASKKRLVVFGTISILVIVYFVFQLVSNIYSIHNLKQEQNNLNNDYKKLKRDEKELRNEIEKLKDADYIARYARENYSYSKDGEYILKLSDDLKKEDQEESDEFSIDYNYFIYGGIGILFFLIIHVVFKKK